VTDFELYPANILFGVCWDVIKEETNASRIVMPKLKLTVSLVSLQCKSNLKNIFWSQIKNNIWAVW